MDSPSTPSVPRSVAPIRKFDATNRLRVLMSDYYRELEAATDDPDRPVAWCTSVGPVELLRALGFCVYFPENHGALLGVSRRAAQYIPAATAAGYSPEICSYLTSDIGAYLSHKTPLSRAYGINGLPRPDVLVYNTNQCRDVQHWFAFYQREFEVPLLGITSPTGVGELGPALLDGVVDQHRALIPPLERVARRTLDPERLAEVVGQAHRCSRLWGEVLGMAENRPSPLTFFDACIQMGPAVVLRGDPRAVAYYEVLLAELRGRVEEGVAAVAGPEGRGERCRLYWEGMPVWGKLREHAELLSRAGAAVVASTYCNSWIFEALADEDPLRGMARAYLELFIVRDDAIKERTLEQMARRYGVDGLVFHESKTCPNNSNTLYGLPGRLGQRIQLPFVTIHGDLNDLRLYSEEQTVTQLEALLEQIEEQNEGQALGPGTL